MILVFSFPTYKFLEKSLTDLPGFKPGHFDIKRFPNQELHLELKTAVMGKKCLVMGSIAPPDDNLLTVTLLADTLKRAGATEVIGFLPYLAYSRQDKKEPGESLTTAWVSDLLKASGVDKVVTIDVHSVNTLQFYNLNLENVSPASLFATKIKEANLTEATLVAPDSGAIKRCQNVASHLHLKNSIAFMVKRRAKAGVFHSSMYDGPVGEKAILIDDILDTGSTLISACETLQKEGVKEVYVFVTHGLFTEDKWQKLFSLGVKQIYTTNSVPIFKKLPAQVETVHIEPLVRATFKEKQFLKEYELTKVR